jgi:hypothetical protein
VDLITSNLLNSKHYPQIIDRGLEIRKTLVDLSNKIRQQFSSRSANFKMVIKFKLKVILNSKAEIENYIKKLHLMNQVYNDKSKIEKYGSYSHRELNQMYLLIKNIGQNLKSGKKYDNSGLSSAMALAENMFVYLKDKESPWMTLRDKKGLNNALGNLKDNIYILRIGFFLNKLEDQSKTKKSDIAVTDIERLNYLISSKFESGKNDVFSQRAQLIIKRLVKNNPKSLMNYLKKGVNNKYLVKLDVKTKNCIISQLESLFKKSKKDNWFDRNKYRFSPYFKLKKIIENYY